MVNIFSPRYIFLIILVGLASAWTAQDREIFGLRDAIENDLGSGTTFYDWLKVDRTATDSEIAKAYRTLSRTLHPDKNPSKSATERFTRLGLVVKVLRGEARERYDFFLDKGFPRWKGTDYYYSRYRPGLVTVLIFLYFLAGMTQYTFLRLTANQHRKHMSMIIDEVKRQAWGDGIPSTQRKVVLPNGKTFMAYPGGDIALLDDGAEHPLNIEGIKNPALKDTILYKVPEYMYYRATGKTPLNGARVLGGKDDERSSAATKSKPKPKPALKVGSVRQKNK